MTIGLRAQRIAQVTIVIGLVLWLGLMLAIRQSGIG